MKPTAAVVVAVASCLIVCTASITHAQSKAPSTPAASTSVNVKSVPPPAAPKFYKPSIGGSNVVVVTDKQAATLTCVSAPKDGGKSFAIIVEGATAHCKRSNESTSVVTWKCNPGDTYVVDDKMPAAAKTKGINDQCLKAGQAANLAASYFDSACETDSSGGYFPTRQAGPDVCRKTFKTVTVQLPGAADGYERYNSQTSIEPTKTGVPQAPPAATAEQLAKVTVKCPANSVLEQNGNGVYCKGN